MSVHEPFFTFSSKDDEVMIRYAGKSRQVVVENPIKPEE